MKSPTGGGEERAKSRPAKNKEKRRKGDVKAVIERK